MESLQGHFLIAMPSLNDTFFEKSVIYLCEHDDKGAMGLVINKPIGLDIEGLLEQMELNPSPEMAFKLTSQVVVGGPVSPERGFVLHTPQSEWVNSFQVSDFCMLTSSRDVLNALASENDAPENFIVALGYAGWSKDQLEQELADNTWLTIKASPELLYDLDYEQLWQKAAKQLGFDIWQLNSQVGHA
ncbi:YqgE/AlgH family protein [Shewanella maritima]|uniref:YqgE/AlgH family protein n=1 Tax=Shewanella maritima TaxID=2520507 RepID=UPI0037366A47